MRCLGDLAAYHDPVDLDLDDFKQQRLKFSEGKPDRVAIPVLI